MWKDLRLEELLREGPSDAGNVGEILRARRAGGGASGSGGAAAVTNGTVGGNLRA